MVAEIAPAVSMSGRQRSRSPGKNSYDSRYDDDYSYRSDSFVSDTGSDDRRKKGSVYKQGGRGKAGSKMTGGRTTNQKDYLKKRVRSAKRLKVNELSNEIEELNSKISELTHNNRILRRVSQRNEREVDKFQSQESDLPKLLASHSQEVRALRDQTRKQKEKYNRADKKLRDTEDELRRTKKQLKKLEDLNKDKKLAEREDLSQRLFKMERDYEEKDTRCKNLERHVENLTKNQKAEFAKETSKQREANRKYKDLRDEFEKLQIHMKEKEKELELYNIHSYRIMKAPHHLSTRSSPTPLPPAKQKKQRANTTSPNLSPRDKAKLFEDKRREEQKKAREAKDHKKKEERPPPKKVIRSPSPVASPTTDDITEEIKEEDSFFMTASDRENSLFAAADKRDKEERERRKRDEQEKKEKETMNRKKAADDKLKRERERIKQESEKRIRKEKERQERERVLQEQKERDEMEEAERRGKEQQKRKREEEERKIREEQERLQINEAAQDEERRKKDALLAKLREIDDKKSGSPKKDSLNSSPRSHRKPYHFTQPVENMHNGKPSHDDVTAPVLNRQRRKSDDIFDDDFAGGYQPSTGRRATRNNTDQGKSELLTSLFNTSNETKRSSFGEDDIFSSSTKAKPVSDKKAYPWEKEVKTNSPTRWKNNDDMFTNTKTSNSPLLPRRPRQQATTFHTKPTVNAIDDIDDDIEEVIL